MRKVLVIGPGAAGKTTFASAFAERTGLARPDLPAGCPDKVAPDPRVSSIANESR